MPKSRQFEHSSSSDVCAQTNVKIYCIRTIVTSLTRIDVTMRVRLAMVLFHFCLCGGRSCKPDVGSHSPI